MLSNARLAEHEWTVNAEPGAGDEDVKRPTSLLVAELAFTSSGRFNYYLMPEYSLLTTFRIRISIEVVLEDIIEDMDTPTADSLTVDNSIMDISADPQKPKKKKSSGILGCDQCRRRKVFAPPGLFLDLARWTRLQRFYDSHCITQYYFHKGRPQQPTKDAFSQGQQK